LTSNWINYVVDMNKVVGIGQEGALQWTFIFRGLCFIFFPYNFDGNNNLSSKLKKCTDTCNLSICPSFLGVTIHSIVIFFEIFFIIILLLWGHIVTFIKVLTKYIIPKFTHFIILLYSPSPIPRIVSAGLIFHFHTCIHNISTIFTSHALSLYPSLFHSIVIFKNYLV
jgi:hypothetical protein